MKFLIKTILGLLVFSTLIFSQDYNKYNIFYRTFEAQYYGNIDSIKYTESTIRIYKPEFGDYKWTYYSETFSKIPLNYRGRFGWQRIEEKWAGGQWKPVDDLTIYLRCDSIRVTSKTWKLENEIIYKRYPPDNNERHNDFWMKFEVDGFVIHRYCYTCREFHKLHNYSNKKRL